MKSMLREEHKPFSLDYEFYSMRFRPDLTGSIQHEEMMYEELKQSMPERFDLKYLDDIFASWFKELVDGVNSLPPLNSMTTGTIQVLYEHGNHKYFSDHYISTTMMRGVMNKELCVILANDGFIYSKPVLSDGINTFAAARPRQRSTTFVYLDVSHVSSLQKMKEFAGDYLGTKELNVKLYYDYHTNRFDFKAYNRNDRSKGVVISFEHRLVQDDNLDDDYWLEVDIEDEESTEQDT